MTTSLHGVGNKHTHTKTKTKTKAEEILFAVRKQADDFSASGVEMETQDKKGHMNDQTIMMYQWT